MSTALNKPAHTLMTRAIARRIQAGPRMAYRIGLGPLIGRLVLLLTTTGRKSGLARTTPLQYETLDGLTWVISSRGEKADWVRNLRADPHAHVQIGDRDFAAQAELITDPARIADVLEVRLAHHPRLVGAMLRADGLPMPASRADLEAYAEGLVMVGLRPE